MEHGSGKRVLDTEVTVTVKTEVEVEVPSEEIHAVYIKEEPGLGQSMKSEPASLVKQEIPENCTQGTSAPAYAGSGDEACSLGDLPNVKDEPSDMDIGPTVLQHMDIHYNINQMANNRDIWEPASGGIPGKVKDFLETDECVESQESGSEVEEESDEDADDGIYYQPSVLTDSGADNTDSMSPLPHHDDPPTPVPPTLDAHTGLFQDKFSGNITTSPFSSQPGTSRDSERWTGVVDENVFRSRSPLPGPSRQSPPWATREDKEEDVVNQEEWQVEWLEEEEEEGSMDVLDGMPDFVNPTPCLSESVAPRRPVQRGLPSRDIRARGVTSGGVRSIDVRARGVGNGGVTPRTGRRAATFAANDKSRWRLGDELIQIYVTNEDVPHELREMTDAVHERNVRRDELARRRVCREHVDESDSDYDHDSEQGLFGGDSTALHFDWSSMETYQSSAEKFLPETTGPVRSVSSAYDAFRVYWDDDIMQHIVVETNRHAADISLRSPQFAKDWIDTNVDELMILFAFWMALGIHKMPTLQSCFSINPVLQTNIFASLFTQRRYRLVNRALHFVDNSTRTPQSSRLYSLGPVIDHLKAAFRNAYTPGRDISIDKSSMLWKGNLVFKQYIRTKAAKFGIKTFELCESATGYLWDFNVYTGNDTSGASSGTLPKSTKAVLDLITPLLNKGYRLFLDNWFNSPILARYLKRNGTDCVGLLRKNRRNVPSLIQCATLPRGHFVARHAGDVVVMAYEDTKTIHTMSTCHGVELVQFSARPGRPSHHKPAVVAEYNKHMGGVDKKDQMLEPHLIERKRCQKWTRKLFKRLLNVSILNSRILLQQSSNDQCEHLVYRVDLIEEIVRRHLSQVPKPRQFRRQVSNKIPGLPDDRLLNPGQHFIVRAGEADEPLTGKNRSSKNRGLCEWCKVRDARYSKTVYKCEFCNVYLCLINCFKNYHTLRE